MNQVHTGVLCQIERFLYRRSRRLLESAAQAGPCRVVIGAGGIAQPGWIATEGCFLSLLQPSDWARFFGPGQVEALMAEHVWEHVTIAEGRLAARLCWTYLRPGARLRVAVPDGLHPDGAYIGYVKPRLQGGCSRPHKVLYTYRTLSDVFTAAGFDVRLLEYFDEDGRFHEEPWDPKDGLIRRSRRFDHRNRDSEFAYTSIILDAIKPKA